MQASFLLAFLCCLIALPVQAKTFVEMQQWLFSPDAACVEKPDMTYYVSLQTAVLYDNTYFQDMGYNVRERAQRAFVCNGEKVGVYLYECGDGEEGVTKVLNYVQPLIWGEAGPSWHHPERIYRHDQFFVVVSSHDTTPFDARLSIAPKGPELGYKPSDDLSDEVLDRFKSFLKCDQPMERLYCEALDGFKGGAPLTVRNKNLAGSSLLVKATLHEEEAGYVVLKNGNAFYSNVTPDNPQEAVEINTYLKKIHTGVTLIEANPIIVYVQTLGHMATYPLQTIGKSSFYRGNNFIFMRQNGRRVYAVEPVGDINRLQAYYIGFFEIPGTE
jgi:hypothetical protein